jgi:prevent-host-death family protein
MQTVNIHEAKTHLSKLIEQTLAEGEGFVIARAGKPVVKVVPLDQAEAPKPRFGFLKGRMTFPDDFDTFGQEEIEAMFEGRS